MSTTDVVECLAAFARGRLFRTESRRYPAASTINAVSLAHLPRTQVLGKRVEERGLIGLEDGDRRPKRVRRPQWSLEVADAVLRLREAQPGMGKEKLWKLLDREGMHTSISTVGRILKRLKARGCSGSHPEMGSAHGSGA